MNIQFSIEEVVQKRYSVRNYSDQAVEPEKKRAIERFVDGLENPFGCKVHFHFLDHAESKSPENLGTYGVIKGAKQYIATTVELRPLALEALGYELETLMLYLAHLDLGSCWLGGTFHRRDFAKSMNIQESEVFPAVTPYGYAASRKHIQEIVMRKIIRADQRKEWNQLFFCRDFQTPLTKGEAGDLDFPLEMIRLGPSASNKQPWRIVYTEQACHFYEDKQPGYSDVFSYDIQQIDLGIAAAHFDLAAKEKGIQGHFDPSADPKIEMPDHMIYEFSWIRE